MCSCKSKNQGYEKSADAKKDLLQNVNRAGVSWTSLKNQCNMLTTNAFASYKKDTAMRRSEALRQSMLAVMKSPAFGHPAFWAPYALVGEGGR